MDAEHRELGCISYGTTGRDDLPEERPEPATAPRVLTAAGRQRRREYLEMRKFTTEPRRHVTQYFGAWCF